jgi:hypothetical protein
MLMKNTYLRPGSFLTTRCYYCGDIVSVNSENSRITLKIEKKEDDSLQDDENSSIINIAL